MKDRLNKIENHLVRWTISYDALMVPWRTVLIKQARWKNKCTIIQPLNSSVGNYHRRSVYLAQLRVKQFKLNDKLYQETGKVETLDIS